MSEFIKPGYTRVTEIFRQWDTYGKKGIDPSVRDRKGVIGSTVHTAIDHFLAGIPPTFNQDREERYFESFLRWFEVTKPNIVEKEERLYCDDLMITGKYDALVKFPNETELLLIDYKTSAQEDEKLWPLQGCFYHYLAKKEGKNISDRVLFIKLTDDGSAPRAFEYVVTKDLLEICKAAVKTYRYMMS
jgi:hypothetical protein